MLGIKDQTGNISHIEFAHGSVVKVYIELFTNKVT